MFIADTSTHPFSFDFYKNNYSLVLIGLILLVGLRLFFQFNLSAQDLSLVLTGVPIYFLFFKHKVNR